MYKNKFLEEFNNITNTSNGIKELRTLILHLAITGKLIDKYSNENSEELYNRIIKQREFLIETKKIKKDKSFSAVYEKIFFDIPSHWKWCYLGEIGDWRAGTTPNRKEPRYYNGEIMWFKSGELNNSVVYASEEKITEKALKETSLRLNQIDDVMIAMYGATIGKTAIVGNISTTNQAVCTCTPFSGINSRFLQILLRAYYPIFISMGEGGAQLNISRYKIINTLIPLPPTIEQEFIVEKVDELMKLCDQLENYLHEQEKIREKTINSIFNSLINNSSNYSLFKNIWNIYYSNSLNLLNNKNDISKLKGFILDSAVKGLLIKQNINKENAEDQIKAIVLESEKLRVQKNIKKVKKNILPYNFIAPFIVPSNWGWVTLDQICYQITDGAHHTPIYTSKGIPFLSVKDLTNGGINFSNTRYVSEETYNDLKKRCNPEKYDLLLTKIGTTGIPKVIDVDKKFSLFVSVALLKFPYNKVNPYFLELVISSPFVKEQSKAGTQGVGNKNLLLNTIKAITIPFPPLIEQEKIVEKVNSLMNLCNDLEQQLAKKEDISKKLASITISYITGIKVKEKEKMKVPKNELISILKIKKKPTQKDDAPLAKILLKYKGELSSKLLWNYSELDIENFYMQLKIELENDWIEQPEVAKMIDTEEK